MIKYIIFIIICGALAACDPCDDNPVCAPNPESIIWVKFDKDSLNGGFTEVELKNVYRTGANEPLNSEANVQISGYYHDIFYVYYCCDYNGIKILNKNTNTEHIINAINFNKKNVKCCFDYYYVEDFKYNGVKMNAGDTIVIKNT